MVIDRGLLATAMSSELVNGNVVLWLLGACSVIAIAIFVERVLQLSRAHTDTSQLMPKLRGAIERGQITEAMKVCDKAGGSVARILRAGLERHDRDKAQIESAMEVTGVIEIAQLERNTKVLSIIAHIAPLTGLLGTVLGFMQAFSQMRQTGLMDISAAQVGGAMEYALETTAAGLVVAIPAIVAYNYIVSRVEHSLLEMQSTSTEIADLLINCTPENTQSV